MATKNQAESAVGRLENKQVEEDDQFADKGGLVMSDESDIEPAGKTVEEKAEDKGGLLMSDEPGASQKFKAVDEDDKPDPRILDVKPDFSSLPEDDILANLRIMTGWLRDRGAIVRKPEITELSSEDGKAFAVTSDKKTSKKKPEDVETVYEATMEWEFQKYNPITITYVDADRLEALRGLANEAFARRYEV